MCSIKRSLEANFVKHLSHSSTVAVSSRDGFSNADRNTSSHCTSATLEALQRKAWEFLSYFYMRHDALLGAVHLLALSGLEWMTQVVEML